MPIFHEPGEEYEIKLGNRSLFAKAMSWREQKEFLKKRDAIVAKVDEKDIGPTEEIDHVIEAILDQVKECQNGEAKRVPATECWIADHLDRREICEVFVLLENNMTEDEKKS